MIRPEKQQALQDRMLKLHIRDKDLEEQFVQGGGKGGQKINKTASCVVLKHLPTGIVIKCQMDRSRELNRYYARKELCDRLEGKDSKKAKEIAKKKKQKKRRERRSKSGENIELGNQGVQDGQDDGKSNAPPEIVNLKPGHNQGSQPGDKSHDHKGK